MIYVIDLFCGAGGVTEGIERAKTFGKKSSRVVACVNHDRNAINSHKANHARVWHFQEDIRTFDVSQLASLVAQYRKKDPGCKIIIWASLECTNFSKAKGGLSRDADSRTLCDHLDRYVIAINPDGVWIENVREFRDHGPIRIKATELLNDRSELAFDSKKENYIFVPDKTRMKEYFNAWRDRICSLGFRYEDRDLNSADFGEYTKRIRYFAQFARKDFPLVWPEPTHSKNPLKGSKLKKWKPVKEVLDFYEEGKSIFNRKKDLSTKTMGRIYAGLVKYVAGGEKAFLSKYFSGDPASKNLSVQGPAHALTTIDHHSLVQPAFISKYLSNNQKTGVNPGASIDEPSPTVTTQNRLALVQTAFLQKYYTEGGNLGSIDEPMGSLTTKDRDGLVVAEWLDKNYSGESNHQSVEEPAGSLTTKDHYSLIKAEHFIDRQFSQGTKHQSIEEPAGSLLTVPKMSLVKVEPVTNSPWVMDTNFNNSGSSVEEPLPTILACRKHHYLINPQYNNKGNSVEDPCFTLIARMDKAAPGIVTIDQVNGELYIPILETDCENTIKIKKFMAIYGICDIKMRMLNVTELKRIQGFPENYYLAGPQDQQKKYIGNSVTPKIPKAMIEATTKALAKGNRINLRIAA